MIKKIGLVLIVTLFLAGCVSQNSKDSNTSGSSEESNEPDIVNLLPKTVDEYRYAGFKNYRNKLGYSLRYIKDNEIHHHADIYIWDTPTQISSHSHRDIVYSATNAAIREIHAIAAQGRYSKIEFLEKLAFGADDSVLTLHKISMQKDNLAVISFLYVSEYKGNLLKARITLPDNEFNRSRNDVHVFVGHMFAAITEILENP